MSFSFKPFALSGLVCLLGSASVLVYAPAHAGFDWTPPEEAAPVVEAPQATNVMPMPPVEVEAQALEDMKKPVMAAPMPKAAPMPAPVAKQTPVAPKPVVQNQPVMKTKVLDKAAAPAPVKPLPATTQAAKPIAAPESVSSVPARVKPPMTSEQLKILEQEKLAEQGLAPAPIQTAPVAVQPASGSVTPMPVEEAPKKSSGLKINPYPVGKAPAPAKAMPSMQKESVQWNEPKTFAVVEGFGSDIPLAMALSQIVPADYAYAFGDGVNPGARVSWSGGKPWNEILKELLTPMGIATDIEGNTLRLERTEKHSMLETTGQKKKLI